MPSSALFSDIVDGVFALLDSTATPSHPSAATSPFTNCSYWRGRKQQVTSDSGLLESSHSKVHATSFGADDPISCVRNYTSNCPEGWEDVDGAGNCWPPVSYQGYCKNIKTDPMMEKSDKVNISHRCRVKWPCAQRATLNDIKLPEDFTRVCPLGWNLIKKGTKARPQYVCRAPEQYTGPCHAEQNLSDFAVDERRTFGRICDVVWPSKKRKPSECSGNTADWSFPCPGGWDYIKKSDECVAPPEYSPKNPVDCPKRLPAFGSKDEKLHFAAICELEGWACKPVGTCDQYDFSQHPCPRKWVQFGFHCLPPQDSMYANRVRKECRRPWHVDDINNEKYLLNLFTEAPDILNEQNTPDARGKFLFGELCRAKWPCVDPNDPGRVIA